MIVVDTHLHLYDEYDWSEALRGCVGRLSALAPQAVCAGVLVDRFGQGNFRALTEGRKRLEQDFSIRVLDEGKCIKIQSPVVAPLYLFAGRQIVTAERLEILCLGVDADIPDGLAADIAVRRIREVGGIAVLTWAVGKWLFARAKVVQKLLSEFTPDELLLGDSAMRPIFWPQPKPMRWAVREHRVILAGTDPLPAAGEERVMGSFASLLKMEFDETNALASLNSGIFTAGSMPKSVGRRSGVVPFIRRMANSL